MGLRSLAAALLFSISVATAAHAQSVTVRQYQGAPAADDGFAVMRPVVPGHLRASARLHLDYANDPLVYQDVADDADSERTAIISDQLTAQLALALGLTDSAMVYLGMPVDLLMKGDTLAGLPRSRGTGVGDAVLGARWQLFAPKGEQGVMIALDGQMTFPLAHAARPSQELAGESKVSGAMRALLEGSIGPLRVTAIMGLRFRPDTRLNNARLRDELIFELSLLQPLVRERLFAHVEIFAKSAMDDVARVVSTPVSALLGLRLRVSPVTLGLAGGMGLTRGYGAPDALAVVSAAIELPERESSQAPVEVEEPAPEGDSFTHQDEVQTDSERPLATDGVEAVEHEESAPVAAPAPSNGWVDSDADGLRDADDQCPRAPGEEGNQGCPRDVRLDLDAGVIEVLRELKFDGSGIRVLGRSFPTLEEVQAILVANPEMKLQVEGYTSNEQSPAISLGLSQQRAGSVRDLLIEWGIDHERVSAVGCGSVRPVAPNDKSWGRKKNERVELRIVTAGAAPREGCQPAP